MACVVWALLVGAASAAITPDDTDGDGLSDVSETDTYGTDPALTDTDRDGLSDGDELIAVLLIFELACSRLVFSESLGRHLFLAEQLGDLESTGRIRRIESGHLPQELEGVGPAALAVVAVGGGLKRTHRLGVEPHPLIELGERDIGCIMLRIEIQDLFVDRDRSGIEAVLAVLLGNLDVLGDRVFRLTPSPIGVPDLEQELRVARVGLEEEVVLLQRLGLRALLRQFPGSIKDFSFIERQ